MHELAITQQIVDMVCERAGERRVTRVVVEIGKLAGVMVDSVRFCFDACKDGTVAGSATLEVIETPGRGRCRACGESMPLESPLDACKCGSCDLEWLAGDELRVREMEVDRV